MAAEQVFLAKKLFPCFLSDEAGVGPSSLLPPGLCPTCQMPHSVLGCILGCVDTEEADIYLLIDGSGSTQATDFQEMKTFLSEVAGMFNIAPQKVRVGAVQYADRWDLEFEISKYTNKHDVRKAIENIRQMGGNRNTGAALNFTLGLLQRAKQQRGGRVPCHLVVLTNGASRDSVSGPANRLSEELVHVYAIGVREANQTQLREIAGEEKRVYYVHDFDALKDIRNQVVQEICAEEGRTPYLWTSAPKLPPCSIFLNVLLLLLKYS